MLTFTSLPSSTAPDPNLASLVASDVSNYVGGSQPLVGVVVDTSGPNLAINISAVYPTNSQVSGADTVNPASLQVRVLDISTTPLMVLQRPLHRAFCCIMQQTFQPQSALLLVSLSRSKLCSI